MSLTDQFIKSCNNSDDFPKNLIKPETLSYNLNDYYKRLNDRDRDLFSPEDEGQLTIWEYDDEKQQFQVEYADGTEDLTSKLRGKSAFDRQDPRCRFIFVLAAQSRAPLDTSRKMLMYAFTYHQVMPAFLDFLFPFGQQIYTQDFFFSGFRHENQLLEADAGPSLPKLRRSGREIRMCYSLKSVERVDELGPEQSWSVRQTATYHSFDVETGVALWISVKGNDLIEDRIRCATENLEPNQRPFSTKDRAFQESLESHLINCKWAGEEWRWYLNFLEEELQGNTRRTLSAKVVRGRRPEEEATLKFLKTRTMSTKKPAHGNTENNQTNLLQPASAISQARASRNRSASRESRMEASSQDQFSFSDLQHVQSLEDKANEVIFVLNTNIEVLNELKGYYKALTTSEECNKDFSTIHRRSVERFQKQITIIVRDLQMQISRAGTLVRTLANRKALLYGILNHRNTVASNSLASKSQQSADNMEKMTRNMETLTQEMNELAKKTKQETVSMRIITLVTLFFLPGTFISTIMSTDIIRFQSPSGGPGPKVFQAEALILWSYASVPLIVVTFAAWGIIYKIELWKAEKRQSKKKEDEKEGGV